MISQVVVLLAVMAVLMLQSATAFRLHMSTVSRDMVLKPFQEGKALKVISGLFNFDSQLVSNVATAAEHGGASHIDIACDPNLVRIAKTKTTLPICVSSVKPQDFQAAIDAGADMIEIGNFDGFYEQGLTFSALEVLAMATETRSMYPTIPLSVTVPHTLPLHEQITLAKELEQCGVDLIQTEGKTSAHPKGLGVQEMIELAAPSIASAFALSRAVSIPVICSSGVTDVTAPLALAAGARGVGVGSMVNKLPQTQQMIMAVTSIATAMGRSIAQKEIRTPEEMKMTQPVESHVHAFVHQ